MVDRYLSSKFGVNPHDGFRGNDAYGWTTTDDGRETYARAMTVALLCSKPKQS